MRVHADPKIPRVGWRVETMVCVVGMTDDIDEESVINWKGFVDDCRIPDPQEQAYALVVQILVSRFRPYRMLFGVDLEACYRSIRYARDGRISNWTVRRA